MILVMATDGARPQATTAISVRVGAALGVIPTVLTILLGAAWPSIFTLVAIALLPAVVGLPWYVVAPSVIRGRPLLRWYLMGAVALGTASVLFEIYWLNGGCKAFGECV